VKGKAIHPPVWIRAALGAALAVLGGLLLAWTPLGDAWENASYDYLFRFGSRAVTNEVTFVLMDNQAFEEFHQTRREPWSRSLHTQLLNRLADDGCALTVCDSFFRTPRNSGEDQALADAMERLPQLVLMAEQAQMNHPGLAGAKPVLPAEVFLQAAKTNWGVAWLDPDTDGIVRKHWPFPADGPYPSLPETAARVFGCDLPPDLAGRWLRYYSPDGPGEKMSYRFALTQPPGYFRNRIVFIGTQPATSLPDGETDEFKTPYSRWTGKACGGVEIMATEFLNLVNQDWLKRESPQTERWLLVVTGILLGAGLCRLRPLAAGGAALLFAGAGGLAAVLWSHQFNVWFPWLIISGAQVPCALAVSLATHFTQSSRSLDGKPAIREKLPVTPGYKLIQPPIGRGAYGSVWLARNRAGQWRALKAIYLARFNDNTSPFEREFNGITRYQPLSGRHPGLLTVEFVSEKRDGYFYYVMELADSLTRDWERKPVRYQPHDLAGEQAGREDKRFSVGECVRIGITLAEALAFLHQQGITHRDIKPQNVVFVGGRPKLADLGLTTHIRPDDQPGTIVGTPGFMPPPPETPGTPLADIFSLGMVLYVIATGQPASAFPDLSTLLVAGGNSRDFLLLNAVILKACQPDATARYQSAEKLKAALTAIEDKLNPAGS